MSKWAVRKAWQKAIKIILITTLVYFHLKRGIQIPPSTADKGSQNHIIFQEGKEKKDNVGTVAGGQPPALRLYDEGSMLIGSTNSCQSAGRMTHWAGPSRRENVLPTVMERSQGYF